MGAVPDIFVPSLVEKDHELPTDFPIRIGDVYIFDPGPTVGKEIRKKRPGVILATIFWPLLLIVPLTGHTPRGFDWEVVIEPPEGGLLQTSVTTGQIRVIDPARLVKRLGQVGGGTLSDIRSSITFIFSSE